MEEQKQVNGADIKAVSRKRIFWLIFAACLVVACFLVWEIVDLCLGIY